MPGHHPPVTLRLEPHLIPAMRAAFDESLFELTLQLTRLEQSGYVPEPWLGDRVSVETAAFYNAQVMNAPTGPYAAMRAYMTELIKVRDTLMQMEGEYRRTEGENADRWGRA